VFVRPDSPRRYDAAVELRRLPDQTDLFIDSANLHDKSGAGFSASGQIAGAGLYDLSVAVLSAGGSRLTNLDMIADLTPDLMHDLAPDSGVASLRGMLFGLTSDQIDPQSRIAGEAFVAALPGARGQLRLSVQSDRGIGLIQLALSSDQPTLPKALAFLLSGARVSVGWQPR
jgi:hypothetical protein